jgi:hypothetical protein
VQCGLQLWSFTLTSDVHSGRPASSSMVGVCGEAALVGRQYSLAKRTEGAGGILLKSAAYPSVRLPLDAGLLQVLVFAALQD